MSNLTQRSFAGGELSPSLWARTEQTKYATGLRTCRNFVVQRHGGVANRPGTVYLASAKDSAQVTRLVKFVYNDDQTYVLEFGDRTLRFYRAGGQIVTAGVSAWVTTTAYAVAALVTNAGVTYYCTTAHTSGTATRPGVGTNWQDDWYALSGSIYEIPTPYAASDLAAMQVVQSGDVITIVHPLYAPRDLSRTGHTAWTIALTRFAPSIGSVVNLGATGGTTGTAYYAVTAIDGTTGEEGLPVFFTGVNHLPASGTPTVLAWDPLGGALTYGVYRSTDGQTYGFLANAGGTLFGRSTTTWATSTSSVSTSTPNVYAAAVTQARNAVVTSVAQKAFDGQYTVMGRLRLQSSNLGGSDDLFGLVRAYYSRDGETRVSAGVIANQSLTGFDGTFSFVGTLTVPDNGYTTLTIDLVPEAMTTSSGATVTATLTETTAPDNAITWQGNGTGYTDVGTVPDYTVAPPSKQTLFAAPGDYPSAVTYYQQRRLFANTTNNPERVWGSRSGSFSSFTTSTPEQDDDMVSFSLASRSVNAVQHMLDVGRLLLFTKAGEWVVGESEQDVLTPTSINARQRLYHGASTLSPIVVGNAVLYVQARGAIVRDLFADVVQGYRTNDLTLFASHLIDGYSLVSWDFAQTPHSTLWAVRSDGVLLGLTYIREQDVWGWHRHDTDGVVEQVCVVPEGSEDAVYLVVRRTINGVQKRYVERMASRMITNQTDVTSLHFVDCGLTYDGRNTGTETVTLSGGTAWDNTEQITVTRSVGGWTLASVGDRMDLTTADGTLLRVVLEGYTSGTIMTGRAQRTVPAALRGIATPAWAWAVRTVTGLSHLEGKRVAVLGDGLVAASPNNAKYPVATVAGGSITLSQPYAVIRAGLPYISDLETLDLDTPSGPSMKEHWQRVSVVGLMVERARGLWAGMSIPTGTDPLLGLLEYKPRDGEDYATPVSLTTDYLEIGIDTNWTGNGRIGVRQVDPLPVTILSVAPQGNLSHAG